MDEWVDKWISGYVDKWISEMGRWVGICLAENMLLVTWVESGVENASQSLS